MDTYKLSAVSFPCRNLILAGHRQMNSIDHDTVPGGCSWGRDTVGRVEQTLIVA